MSRIRGRQNGVVVFEVDARDDETAAAEARRYALQYAEDGPVVVQNYTGKRWANLWTIQREYDPTDVSALVATVDDVLNAGAPTEDGEWFILRTAPQKEFRALKGLAEIKLTSYCPCETRYRGKIAERRRVKSPLFVGYLFVYMPSGRGFWDVHLIDGVQSILLGTNNMPQPVAASEVERFRKRERDGKFDHTLNAKEAKKETERLKANFADLQSMGPENATAFIMAVLDGKPIDQALAA